MGFSPTDSFLQCRQLLGGFSAGLDPALVNDRPAGLGNTLHWQLGHVIHTAEALILGLSGAPLSLPAGFGEWFGRGTSTADYTAATPDWAGLLAVLQSSTAHLATVLPTLPAKQALVQPFALPGTGLDARTVGAVTVVATWHEGLHFGQMRAFPALLAARGGS
ncbi:MAG: DinB family protein [Fimbriimonadaceae bacterium]|nr:DinB family protein [Fimbriimonadaceae bacterium]